MDIVLGLASALIHGREPIQGYRVEEALEKVGLTHGLQAKMDLLGVDVGLAEVAYCPATISITEVFSRGDGGELPTEVTIPQGLGLRFPGTYNIRGALVTANGRITVDASEAQIERVKEYSQ